jgi:hypothetical protein
MAATTASVGGRKREREGSCLEELDAKRKIVLGLDEKSLLESHLFSLTMALTYSRELRVRYRIGNRDGIYSVNRTIRELFVSETKYLLSELKEEKARAQSDLSLLKENYPDKYEKVVSSEWYMSKFATRAAEERATFSQAHQMSASDSTIIEGKIGMGADVSEQLKYFMNMYARYVGELASRKKIACWATSSGLMTGGMRDKLVSDLRRLKASVKEMCEYIQSVQSCLTADQHAVLCGDTSYLNHVAEMSRASSVMKAFV